SPYGYGDPPPLHSFPTRRSSDLTEYGIADLRGRTDEQCVMAMLAICDARFQEDLVREAIAARKLPVDFVLPDAWRRNTREDLGRSEEHTSELQSRENLVCRLLLE